MSRVRIRASALAACYAFYTLVTLGSTRAGSYIDPALLNMPWGNYSFTRDPWRGYLETVPAVDYLDGLGVVWNRSVPDRSADWTAAELSWAGFARVRVEMPWGAVRWDEKGLDAAAARRFASILEALRAHHLRPLILLNANHLDPCPVHWSQVVVRRDASAGSRTLNVTGSLSAVTAGHTTIMSLADSVKAGPIIVGYTHGTAPTLELSKPLSRSLKAGEKLRLATLKYLPLFGPGTPEFERTIAGWLRYVRLVADFTTEHYGDDFDVEMWNEYSFGSAFLDINNYMSPAPGGAPQPEPFHRGGRIWELADRTVRTLHDQHPRVKVIWGFSNTSFFHVATRDLPRGTDGQSYHPYGTGRRCYADIVKHRRRLLVDDKVPSGCIVEPEGSAHTWDQTESLMRLLAPQVRNSPPPGTRHFRHFISEHGFRPAEIGIVGPAAAARAKSKFLLRAPMFWLNKGISALYVYAVYETDPLGFGIFDADGGVSPAMRALHMLTRHLAAAEPISAPRRLTLSLDRSDGGAAADSERGETAPIDRVAILPFQVTDRRFALGVYVMTRDFPADLPPREHTLSISGVRGDGAAVSYYSPFTDSAEPVKVKARSDHSITVTVGVTDVPRLLEITEAAARAKPRIAQASEAAHESSQRALRCRPASHGSESPC